MLATPLTFHQLAQPIFTDVADLALLFHRFENGKRGLTQRHVTQQASMNVDLFQSYEYGNRQPGDEQLKKQQMQPAFRPSLCALPRLKQKQ